jgi:hypothetical protein
MVFARFFTEEFSQSFNRRAFLLLFSKKRRREKIRSQEYLREIENSLQQKITNSPTKQKRVMRCAFCL